MVWLRRAVKRERDAARFASVLLGTRSRSCSPSLSWAACQPRLLSLVEQRVCGPSSRGASRWGKSSDRSDYEITSLTRSLRGFVYRAAAPFPILRCPFFLSPANFAGFIEWTLVAPIWSCPSPRILSKSASKRSILRVRRDYARRRNCRVCDRRRLSFMFIIERFGGFTLNFPTRSSANLFGKR